MRRPCLAALFLCSLAHSLRLRQPIGAPKPPIKAGESWPLARVAFSLLPLTGAERRKTVEKMVVRDSVWTHDQIQGVVNVNVPVRQTVIKLADGGLWVHNPVAPTAECISMVQALEAKHGAVRHIVLGTLGLEHKALAGPFTRCFPLAKVWVQPGQWSFPLPLPLPLLGFPWGSRLRTLPLDGEDKAAVPWEDEIAFEVLGPLQFPAVGAFGETAFVHRASGTLLVTDMIIKVEEEPPEILTEDPRALLYHSRDTIDEETRDTPQARRRGWRRIAIFGLYFYPADINVRVRQAFADLRRLPKSMLSLGEGSIPLGLYPWEWARDEVPAFNRLRQGRAGLLCAPILQALILNRFPEELTAWSERVAQLRFKRIIPCHFANDIRASPEDFKRAFDFIRVASPQPSSPQPASPAEGALMVKGGRQGGGRGRLSLGRSWGGLGGGGPPLMDRTNPDFTLLLKASELCTRLRITDPPAAGPLVEVKPSQDKSSGLTES